MNLKDLLKWRNAVYDDKSQPHIELPPTHEPTTDYINLAAGDSLTITWLDAKSTFTAKKTCRIPNNKMVFMQLLNRTALIEDFEFHPARYQRLAHNARLRNVI